MEKRDDRGVKKDETFWAGGGVVLIWEGLLTLLWKGVFKKMKIWRGQKSKN